MCFRERGDLLIDILYARGLPYPTLSPEDVEKIPCPSRTTTERNVKSTRQRACVLFMTFLSRQTTTKYCRPYVPTAQLKPFSLQFLCRGPEILACAHLIVSSAP